MPELPEVETIAKKLNLALKNKIIENITVFRAKSFTGDVKLIIGKPIIKVSRRAKLIRFQMPRSMNILAHLKMTGQFIYLDQNMKIGGGHPTQDWTSELPTKHTRVEINFIDERKNNSTLYFNDMRVFGWLKVLSDKEVNLKYEQYGPDINTNQASLSYFKKQLKKTKRQIKQVIMDNKIIAGVGNIYACDGLNLAKINPTRPANSLSDFEISTLLSSLKQVISLGIKFGGATISDYKDIAGFSGKYQTIIRVYGKDSQPCPNCKKLIQKIKIGNRGTFYCSNCQL